MARAQRCIGWSLLAAACLLSGCAAVPDGDGSLGTAPQVLRFVPAGFSSLWVSNAQHASAAGVLPVETEGVRAVAIAGRHFCKRGASVEGDCDAVWVWEAKGPEPPAWWAEMLADSTGSELVCGTQVIHIPGATWGPKDDWFAIVDHRFLVRTTRLSTMRVCLQQNGPSLREHLEARAWREPASDAASIMLIGADPVPSDRSWPSGLREMSFVIHTDGSCSVEAQADSAAALEEWLRSHQVSTTGLLLEAGLVRVESADLLQSHLREDEDAGSPAPSLNGFWLWRLFGFQSFI